MQPGQCPAQSDKDLIQTLRECTANIICGNIVLQPHQKHQLARHADALRALRHMTVSAPRRPCWWMLATWACWLTLALLLIKSLLSLACSVSSPHSNTGTWMHFILMGPAKAVQALHGGYRWAGQVDSLAGTSKLLMVLCSWSAWEAIRKALATEESYMLHRPVCYCLLLWQTIVSGLRTSCNLVKCSQYREASNRTGYLFCCMDVVSKNAWAHPPTSKCSL